MDFHQFPLNCLAHIPTKIQFISFRKSSFGIYMSVGTLRSRRSGHSSIYLILIIVKGHRNEWFPLLQTCCVCFFCCLLLLLLLLIGTISLTKLYPDTRRRRRRRRNLARAVRFCMSLVAFLWVNHLNRLSFLCRDYIVRTYRCCACGVCVCVCV